MTDSIQVIAAKEAPFAAVFLSILLASQAMSR
jgi:hypothetical protein